MILHIIGMIGVDGALYKSMEFTGDGIKNLTMDDRFTIANMAIEAGGKNGIFPVDDAAIAYMKEHSKKTYTIYEADEDAVYDAEYTIDLSALRPTIAFPHLPENTRTIDEITEDIRIDQVVIGSCTNGRIDDMRIAAEVLKGRYRDSGHSGHLHAGHGGRASENLYRSRGSGEHTHLRSLPWRLYGDSCPGRAVRFHHQPQLCGTYGTCRV